MIPMTRTTKTRLYKRLSLIPALFACLSACALVPSAATPTTVPSSTPLATLTPIAPPASATVAAQPVEAQVDTSWQAEYFTNDAWQGPAALSRVDADPLFDWQYGSPDPSIPVDNFTVRWTRCLDLEARYYNFTVSGDDYVKVLVDDIPVVETTTYANTAIPFAVTAGQHCIKIEYREFIGYANLFFSFQPGETLSLGDAGNPWQGEYFNNKEFLGPPTFTRNDPAPQFDWQAGNPAPGIPIDGFSVRWTRCLDMEGREYVFSAHADEYVKVLFDDTQVLEAPLSVNAEAPVSVSAGDHCIKVEYREDAGTANVFFDFK